MLHGVNTKGAVNQLKSEGLKMLYRGILPPLCQKTVSTSIMFGMYDQYYKNIKNHAPAVPPGEFHFNTFYWSTLPIYHFF